MMHSDALGFRLRKRKRFLKLARIFPGMAQFATVNAELCVAR